MPSEGRPLSHPKGRHMASLPNFPIGETKAESPFLGYVNYSGEDFLPKKFFRQPNQQEANFLRKKSALNRMKREGCDSHSLNESEVSTVAPVSQADLDPDVGNNMKWTTTSQGAVGRRCVKPVSCSSSPPQSTTIFNTATSRDFLNLDDVGLTILPPAAPFNQAPQTKCHGTAHLRSWEIYERRRMGRSWRRFCDCASFLPPR
eukprot:GHVN01089843.1.p1 GENE.GHVN01089843.1~~GHVN01089843.1.p1  ORF type:complete len:203 (+),score=14.84 GHVN01089843.1:608-1216(+)